jgi:hypothetical protein
MAWRPERSLGGLFLLSIGRGAVVVVGAAAELAAADDRVIGMLGALVGNPFVVDEPSGDSDRAARCEVFRARVGA